MASSRLEGGIAEVFSPAWVGASVPFAFAATPRLEAAPTVAIPFRKSRLFAMLRSPSSRSAARIRVTNHRGLSLGRKDKQHAATDQAHSASLNETWVTGASAHLLRLDLLKRLEPNGAPCHTRGRYAVQNGEAVQFSPGGGRHPLASANAALESRTSSVAFPDASFIRSKTGLSFDSSRVVWMSL